MNNTLSGIREKYLLLFVISLFSSTLLHSQKIEKYYTYSWKETIPGKARFYTLIQKTDSGWFRNDYFLTINQLQMQGLYEDSASTIENGSFYYFYSNGKLEQKGRYLKGKKQGLWLHYHPNGMMADSTVFENGNPIGVSIAWHSNGYMSDSSNYDANGNGVKITWYDRGEISSAGYISQWKNLRGKWQYFYKNGDLSSSEIYADGKLTSKECFDDKGNKTEICKPDTSVVFPGGVGARHKFLEKNVYFPPGYKFENTDTATVVIRFAIDEEGNVTEPFVDVPLFPQFDKIALETIKKSPKWYPEIKQNRKVKSYHRQPITFTQE